MSPQEDWWASLNHGGLLIAPNKVQEVFGANPGGLSSWRIERLRRELTRFDGSGETLSRLLDFVLEDLSGLTEPEWQKAHRVESRWAISGFTKEQIKPRRIWVGPNGETLPVFVPDTGAARQYGTRLGVGRSRRLLGRVLEWLRRMQQPVALVTNGRQWRLVHAGQDYDAWWRVGYRPMVRGRDSQVRRSPHGAVSSIAMCSLRQGRASQAHLSSRFSTLARVNQNFLRSWENVSGKR